MTTIEKKPSGVTLLVLLAVFLSLFLSMVWPYLVALLMGLLLAILSRPLYDLLVKRGLGPRLAAVAAMTIILLAIIAPLTVFAVTAVKQAIALAAYLADERGAEFIRASVAAVTALKPVQWVIESPADLQAKGLEFAQSAGASLSRMILVQAAALPDLALKLVISLLAWFFLLFEGEDFLKWLMGRVNMDSGLRRRLTDSFRATAASTVWATAAAAAAQALVVMVGFLLLGVPNIFLGGGATFIFAWIPILGSLPVCLAGAVYLYFQGSIFKLALMGLVAVVAGLMDNVVRPIVMKGHGDMHPLLALISIFAGIRMFGILGVIFGPIVAAMLLALLNSWPVPAAESRN
ncbi:MAG: AI-2E family transporter [Elusimicrobiota bacterium]|nr:AI-2E family transporter [Elusimicrobiota bacterium]